MRAVLSDVLDRLVRRIDHPHRENEIEKFRRPILLRRVPQSLILERGKVREGGFVGAQFHLLLREARREFAQKFRRDRAMHEHGLDRVADAGALHLGVDHDLLGHRRGRRPRRRR